MLQTHHIKPFGFVLECLIKSELFNCIYLLSRYLFWSHRLFIDRFSFGLCNMSVWICNFFLFKSSFHLFTWRNADGLAYCYFPPFVCALNPKITLNCFALNINRNFYRQKKNTFDIMRKINVDWTQSLPKIQGIIPKWFESLLSRHQPISVHELTVFLSCCCCCRALFSLWFRLDDFEQMPKMWKQNKYRGRR